MADPYSSLSRFLENFLEVTIPAEAAEAHRNFDGVDTGSLMLAAGRTQGKIEAHDAFAKAIKDAFQRDPEKDDDL